MIRITGPCRTCRFCKRFPEDKGPEGDCHYNAPALDPETLEAIWPRIQLDDWCGHWARNTKPSTATG